MNKLAFLDSIRQGIRGIVDKGYNAVNDAAKSLTQGNLDPRTGTYPADGLSLDQLGNKYHDNLVYGLAGTAVGGGIGALTTDTEEDKTFGDKLRHRLRNALTGGIAGGAVGLGGKVFVDSYVTKPDLPKRPSYYGAELGKKVDNFFGVNKNESLTVEQVANRARAEATAKPGATPKSIDADVKAAVEATTAPLGPVETAVAIANPMTGSEVGRSASGALIAGTLGEGVVRLGNNRIDPIVVSDNVSKRLNDFKLTRMTTGTPGAPGIAAIDPALKAPGAESPYRKGFSLKRLTNQQALDEMTLLRDSPKPGTRALKRYGLTNRMPIGKGPRALQALAAFAGLVGANVVGKPNVEPK